MAKKLLVADIIEKKKAGEKITILTAYDSSFAALLENAGLDAILVGDSLGMVALGYESTVPVTMEEMLHHAKAVRRGAPNTLVIGDMPFLSYQVSPTEAIRNGGRFMKEAGCDAVKLEGGLGVCDTMRAMVGAGIPVMGHIGLTPQTAGQLGGYKLQGKDLDSAGKLLAEARALVEAGAFALVLECIPDKLAHIISEQISIPTIGIGAGAYCDGQVLVTNDMLGLFEKYIPKFVKQYAKLSPIIKGALQEFIDEVRSGKFPDDEYSFPAQVDFDDLLREKDVQE